MVLPQRIHARHPRVKESSVLLWVLSSYLVLRRVDSELIASKVTTSGLRAGSPASL